MTLKECREKRGLSQTELAVRVGLKQTTISQYENGSRKPKLSMAKKLASILGITLDEFVSLSTFIDSAAETEAISQSDAFNSNMQLNLFEDNTELQIPR